MRSSTDPLLPIVETMTTDVWNEVPEEWQAAADSLLDIDAAPEADVPLFVEPGVSTSTSVFEDAIRHKRSANDPTIASFLLSSVAAGLSGYGWYRTVTLTPDNWVDFGAVFIGLFVGMAMVYRVRDRGSVRGTLSLTITICALVITQYFIARHVLIRQRNAVGLDTSHFPLLLDREQSFSLVVDHVRQDSRVMLFWLLSCFAAVKPTFND